MMPSDDFDLAMVSRVVGHDFHNEEWIRRALTHSSMPEVISGEVPSYQRLEFLGDRVLGLVVAEMLFRAFPDADEGELSKRLTRMVRKETCAEISRTLDLGSIVLMSEGEARSGGRNKKSLLGDVCEAVIAAIYMDGGADAAQRFIESHWTPWMESAVGRLRDAKTALQEWAHTKGHKAPTYDLIDRDGPDHRPSFTVEAAVEGLTPETGRGRSKRDAEQAAAAAILVREKVWTADDV